MPVRALQWGRNFIVAEIKQSRKLSKGCKLASMGPQLYRCGNGKVFKEMAYGL